MSAPPLSSGIEADKFHALCLPVLEFIKLEHGHAKKSLGARRYARRGVQRDMISPPASSSGRSPMFM